MDTTNQGERLNKVAKPLKLEFYRCLQQPLVFSASFRTDVAFDLTEVASVRDDSKLEQWVINRTVAMLREQIDHFESLR